MASWICPVYTSCATTAFIKGMLQKLFYARLSTSIFRCLPDTESECPLCTREHAMIREIRRNNEQLADQHELFVSEVQEGGFEALANAFNRGIFNQSRLDTVV